MSREDLRSLSVYWPFAAVLLAVLLIAVLLPGEPQPGAYTSLGQFGSQVLGSDASGSEATSGPEVGAGEGGARQRVAGAARGSIPGGSGITIVGGKPYGPDCDLNLNRLKVPSVYAPPCVPVFSGNNGGKTWKVGVSAKEIVLVFYGAQLDAASLALAGAAGIQPDPEATEKTIRDYIDYFQHHYQLYGRKIRIEFVRASGQGNNHEAAKADAIKVATEIKAFASIGGPGTSTKYAEELAARGVLCIFCRSSVSPDEFHTRLAPYAWANVMNRSQVFVLYGEYVGKRLANRKARWSGDPLFQQRTRKLALVYAQTSQDDDLAANAMERELARYGVKVALRIGYPADLSRAQEQARTIISKLKNEGITTIIYSGGQDVAFFSKEATNQQYFPEWLPALPGLQFNLVGRLADQQQWQHAFGPGVLSTPSYPYEESEVYRVHMWHHGRPPQDRLTAVLTYGLMRLFFTGTYLAGPNLNPFTFRDGLFASPARGGGPTTPYITFGKRGLWPVDDYAGNDDAGEIWWDSSARGADETGRDGFGMYRYTDGGKRYFAGRWPRTEPKVFDPKGSVIAFDHVPAQDRAPTYPHPKDE